MDAKAHDLTAARKNARTEDDAAAIAWAQEEIKRLRDALRAADDADEQKNNCKVCEPETAAEACSECFPSADDARLKRWAALCIHSAAETMIAPSDAKGASGA